MVWAPDYVTAAELKSYLRITDTADDAFVALWITTVSRNVDDECGRQFGKVDTAEARVYSGVWDRHQGGYVYDLDDLYDVDDLLVIGADATEVTDYTLQPENVLLRGRPYERLLSSASGPLTITSPSWGWAASPAAVKIGVFLQGARLAARRDSPFGISGSPQQQGEIRLLAQLDADFRTSLKPWRRNWWAR